MTNNTNLFFLAKILFPITLLNIFNFVSNFTIPTIINITLIWFGLVFLLSHVSISLLAPIIDYTTATIDKENADLINLNNNSNNKKNITEFSKTFYKLGVIKPKVNEQLIIETLIFKIQSGMSLYYFLLSFLESILVGLYFYQFIFNIAFSTFVCGIFLTFYFVMTYITISNNKH